ncbi:uncharacterized protein [Paramormyrops kingsleyae]|uniref:uncharacterized protein n=1 Tax=Paramormyrops kingsleyae TaxID=1676925 RepID=UPI003B972B00
MSALNATVCLWRIDWLLPNGAVSVRIAPEDIPGSVSHGRTSTSRGGRRAKCCTGPPASDPLTTSRGLSGRRRRRQKGPFTKNLRKLLCCSSTVSGNPFDSTHVGDNIPCEDLRQCDNEVAAILHGAPSVTQPEPCSPALSSTSFLFPSPVPSSFVSSPSPSLSLSLFMDSPPSSPLIASPVSPAPSSAPAPVHPTPLRPVPAQATAPSSQLVTGPTPPFMSPADVIEKMERFNTLYNYYLNNYCHMTYEANCFAYYWCQQWWNEFVSAVNICKQWRNRSSEAPYSYGDNEGGPMRHSTDEDELIFPSDMLDQLSAIPGVLEMAVELGYLSDGLPI